MYIYTSGGAAHRLPNAASSQPRPRHERTTSPEPHLISSQFSSSSIFKSSRYLHFHSVRACISSHPLTLFPVLSALTLTAYVTFPARPVGCRVLLPSSHPLPHPLPLYLSPLVSPEVIISHQTCRGRLILASFFFPPLLLIDHYYF